MTRGDGVAGETGERPDAKVVASTLEYRVPEGHNSVPTQPGEVAFELVLEVARVSREHDPTAGRQCVPDGRVRHAEGFPRPGRCLDHADAALVQRLRDQANHLTLARPPLPAARPDMDFERLVGRLLQAATDAARRGPLLLLRETARGQDRRESFLVEPGRGLAEHVPQQRPQAGASSFVAEQVVEAVEQPGEHEV